MFGNRAPPDLLLPPWSHETRPFLHNLRNTAKKKMGKKLCLPPSRTTTLSRYALLYKTPNRREHESDGPHTDNDKHLRKRISSEWAKWQTHKRHYPDITIWWERCVKKKSPPILIRKEQYERNKGYKIIEITYISAYMTFYLVTSQNPPNYQHSNAIKPR